MQDSPIYVITREDCEKRARMSVSASEQVSTCFLMRTWVFGVCRS